MQNLQVVPGQCVSRDEDVLGHHRLWSGKESVSLSFIQIQTENKTRRGVTVDREGGNKPTVTSLVSYDKLALSKVGLMGFQEALLLQPKPFQAC